MVNIKQKSTGEWLKSYEDSTPITTTNSPERLMMPRAMAEIIISEIGDEDWKILEDNQCDKTQ